MYIYKKQFLFYLIYNKRYCNDKFLLFLYYMVSHTLKISLDFITVNIIIIMRLFLHFYSAFIYLKKKIMFKLSYQEFHLGSTESKFVLYQSLLPCSASSGTKRHTRRQSE